MNRLALLCSLSLGLLLPEVAGADSFSPGCRRDGIAAGSRQERTIEVDGTTRTFILDVPETIVPRRAAPLLLDFHGFGHGAEGVWRVSGFRELGVRERFITVYPQGLPVKLLGRRGAGWEMSGGEGNREVAFVERMLDELEQEYCIDRRRVFATGFSNGAFLSHLLGCVLAGRIAAIAPVSGGTREVPCQPGRAVSAIIHHGRYDQLVPVERGRDLFAEWKRVDGCAGERPGKEGDDCMYAVDCRDGAAVVYCEFDGEHRWPAAATARIWEFFARHPMSR